MPTAISTSELESALDRAAVNRANAQHSTGPRTEAGRNRSSQNATKHGLTSRAPFLRCEDPAAYQLHCRQFHDEYQPQTPTEIQLVQELADTAWRLNRIPRLEAELLDIAQREMRRNVRAQPSIAEAVRSLATLGQHSARLSRQFNKALVTLRQIQAARLQKAAAVAMPKALPAQDVPAPNGFVFSACGAGTPACRVQAYENDLPQQGEPAAAPASCHNTATTPM